MSAADQLAAYGALVRQYHQTLDLVSPAALRNWDSLIADALLYTELSEELVPEGDTVLDVGSGAGLPGIPLALTLPDRHVHLVERRRRRSAFLNLASARLGLANATVHHGDVSDLGGISASVVTAQAVGTFTAVHQLTRQLQAPKVLLISSKGPDWRAEAEELEEATGSRLIASSVRERSGSDGLVVGLLFAGGQ